MADIVYRVNLKATGFPLLSESSGRSVIVKGQDQNYIPGLAAKDAIDSVAGIPQIYYCHNILPTDAGYKSIGYDEYAPASFPSATNFSFVLTLREGSGLAARFSATATGVLYVMQDGSSTWVEPIGSPAPGTIAGKRITAAFVSGVTYIYIANVGCYTYNWGTNTLTPVTLTGLVAENIIGVVGNKGYLIAYSTDSVAWSSTLDPTDFTPSLETGAGGGQIEGARGELITIESVYGGMIAFTAGNAVAATASDNVRYPYTFTEITGCGGLQDPDNVSYDANSGALYAYTTSGLQAVTLQKAVSVFPEVTDFISGSLFEDFNENTNELELTSTSGSVIQKRIAMIGDRYLIISYGVSSLTHAIVYDTAYKQFGKLKFPHTDCFEFERTNTEIPKKSIAFLGATGSIHVLNSDINSTDSNGVIILGKYQYVRSRLIQLQGVELENVNAGAEFSLYDLPSLDGKNFSTAVVGYLARSLNKFRAYLFHNTAVNHSLLLKGDFHAVSIVITFTVHGAR